MSPRLTVSALCVAVLFAVGACGSDDTATDASGSPTSTPSSPASTKPAKPSKAPSPSATKTPLPDWPACHTVWVAGKQLAMRYEGCLEGRKAVKAERYGCSFGKPIVAYDDRFYAVPGGPVNQRPSLKRDKQFQHTIAVCQG